LRLLARRATPGAEDDDGTTPLHSACAMGLTNVVERMLEMDADCGMQDTLGRTPLLCAVEAGQSGVCATLLKPVVLPPIAPGHDATYYSRVSNGDVARSLRLASHCGYDKAVAELLRDSDPHQVAAALVVALERGHEAVCTVILHTQAPALDHFPPAMPLPVHAASALGMEHAARQMIQSQDYNPGAVDTLGRTALHYAAKSGLADLCRDLVYLPSVDATAADDQGKTARTLAIEAGFDSVANLLPRAMISPHGTRGDGYADPSPGGEKFRPKFSPEKRSSGGSGPPRSFLGP